MKKPTIFKALLVGLFLIQSVFAMAQELKEFTPRFDKRLKGDMLLIGNNILNRKIEATTGWWGQPAVETDVDYDLNGYNSDFNMKYINIDKGVPGIFSSSSANLKIPKPECYKIVYAGLYWGAILQQNDRKNIENVKLKLPKATAYTDIKGEILYDAKDTPIGGDKNKAYACYADITSLVTGLSDAQGTYTVANVISSEGKNGGTGLSAGWSIFVVYEDPTLPAKYITTFDGFTGIDGKTSLEIDVDGFKTIPKGPVRVKFAFSALEGDQPINGDFLEINDTKISATNAANKNIRSASNFFNSSVTYIDPATGITADFLDRNPKSKNTLGYDAGILNIDNPEKKGYPGGVIIGNNATSAKIKLGTTQDVYFYYFNAFAVDIIEPKIVLTKIVKNEAGVDIGNQNVTLGQRLNYIVGFQNTGNDDAKGLTIRDRLPINTIFNYPADLNPLPAGVSVLSYNSTTRDIIFKIDDNLVKEKGFIYEISFKVQVVPDCKSLSEACSNSIDNSAYATYKGTLNPDFTISDDPSVNTNTGCILVPKATNFLVGIDGCQFEENVTLCGDSVELTAANGYDKYTWSTDKEGKNVVGTSQTLTVKDVGTYYVYNLAKAPCLSIYQKYVVTRFGGIVKNPVTDIADEVVICPNNGVPLPNIYLCGANASRLIKTTINDGSTILWEKSTCDLVYGVKCADESAACTWNEVGSDKNFTVNSEGQYRITINYAGGCFNRFYFNVYQNNLDPTATSNDIICTKNGNITIGGVPSDYQFRLGTGGQWQDSNIFDNITNAGTYTVYIRQKGVSSKQCIFEVKDIQIRKRDFSVSTIKTDPLCFGEKGSIKVAINDVRPQYYFKLKDAGGNILNSVGPTASNEHTFENLTPGKDYVVEGSTDDGCKAEKWNYINQPTAELKATAALIVPLTACTEGKIVVNATGGAGAPYSYFINGSTSFQTSNEILVAAPGKYDILVVDKNNCSTTTSITVVDLVKPTYTVKSSTTSIKCYGETAKIDIALNGSAAGYKVEYSIDNGATYKAGTATGAEFLNLGSGTYNVVVRFSVTYPIPNWPNEETVICPLDPAKEIIITGAASALTASAGVARLAGCTLNEKGGLLRITNVEGGTPGYEYSFDAGATWQASNEKEVLPGSYNLAVKDKLGCIYTLPYVVTLDQKPADPQINQTVNPVYNCNGTATATIEVDTPAGTGSTYTYEYYLDGVVNTPPNNNTFNNVPTGTHSITVKYKVETVSSYSNLLQEDFGYGEDTTSPGINTTYYCWERQVVATKCNQDEKLNDGDYTVTSNIRNPHGTWVNPIDHTSGTRDGKGRYLAVNIGATIPKTAILYQKEIKDIIHNQPINVEIFAINLLKSTSNGYNPDVQLALVDAAGKDISSIATGEVPKSDKWEKYLLTLNPGANSVLKFVVRSNVKQIDGNDLAIDDIKVFQLPESCGNERTFPVIIEAGKAFKAPTPTVQNAQCNGGKGSMQITAENFDTTIGFYYSTDNGVTWFTSTTSPVIITDLAAGSYKVIVQNDAVGTCPFSFDSIITAPTAIVANRVVVTQPTCTNGATIKPSATGGSGTYEFELRGADGLTAIVGYEFSKKLTDFVNVPAGTYTVVAKDVNGCISPASAQISITAPIPPVASLDTSSNLCYDPVNGATLVVKVTGANGSLSYSLDGQPGQNSPTFTKVGVGSHKIIVTDSKNCTAEIDTIIIAPALVAATPAVTGLLCDPATNATITIALSGGTQPYSYTVNGGTKVDLTVGTSTITYSTPTANTYNFAITDATGCTTTASAIVNAITNPTVQATPKQVSCFGGTDGEVTLVGSAGSGGFTYSFEGSNFSITSVYKGLKAGIAYPYQVKDSKGCIGSGTITLTQPSKLIVSASATKLSCSTTNVKQTALVTVDVPTTGTAPYQYSFDNGGTFGDSTTKTITDNGTDQTIKIVVKDKNGCTAPTSVVVKGLNGPTDITFAANAITCNALKTTITATAVVVSGSLVLPLKYEITSPTAAVTNNTDGIFANLAAGTYNFKVTDANGCFKEKPFTIASVTPISVVGNKLNDVLCNGGSTGNGTFTVSKDAAVVNYTFTLTTGTLGTGTLTKTGNTLALKNVAAGTYTVLVTDTDTGCTTTDKIIIGQPNALSVAANGTNVNCTNFSSQITGVASGGTGLYTYAAVKAGTTTAPTVFAANPIIVNTNLGADLVWDVYAKDANGCVAKIPITIVKDAVPTVTAMLDNQCLATANNKFTITATGTGVAPLSYSIDGNSFQTTGKFDNLSSGTYTVTVKDGNGCTATATPVVVLQRLTANAQTTKALDCSATPNAIITTTITDGKTPYSYTVTKDGGTASTPITGVTGPTFTTNVLVADFGVYTFNITDANGCTTTATATVLERTNPTVAIASQVNVSCNAGTNGSVTLIGSGGSGGFTYSDNATSGFKNSPTFTGLANGIYTFYVKDSKGCVGSVPVTITEPAAIIPNATATSLSCSVTNTKQSATITVTPTGGTGTYTYSYDNGLNFGPSSTKVINDNGATQTFQIIVKDANGCTSAMQVVTIAPLNPPSITSIVPSVITCNEQTSSATVTISGGVGTLNYQIISPAVVDNGTNNVFTGLVENVIYTFKVTDANGCYDTESLKINPAKEVTVTKQILSNVDCFGGATGSASFTVGNTVGTISFKLYKAGVEITRPFTIDVTGQIITYTGLAKGTYEFIVTDGTTGCTATETITISEPTAALTATYVAVNANCGVATSKVTVTATGGTEVYKYSFVTSATTAGVYTNSNIANLNPVNGLNWFAHIIDAKGCTFVLPITIASDPVPTVSASAISQCLGSGTYTITAQNTTVPASGIVTPITYSINNGASWQVGTTFTVSTSGDYVILMKDGNGCIATSNTVTVHPKLTLSAVLDKDITCEVGNEEAQFTLTPTGGNPGTKTYEYSTNGGISWSPMASNVLNTSVVGSYTFKVTDLSNCSATTTKALSITTPEIPVITSLTQTQLIGCNNEASAAISVVYNPAVGQAPFVINVKQYSDLAHTAFVKDFGTQTSGLPAGFYVVTVTDAKGCHDEEFITITQPEPIVIDYDTEDLLCVGAGVSKGKIIINSVTGGTPLYDYYVTGINGYSKQVLNVDGSYTFEVVDFGLYQIRVVDSNGCSAFVKDIKIASPPDELIIKVDSSADCATGGKAVVTIGTALIGSGPFHFNIYTGGTPPQIWLADGTEGWQGESSVGSKESIFNNLTPGVTYTFIVYDEVTECYYFQTADAAIPTITSLTLNNIVEQNITCTGSADGSVTFDIVNGYVTSIDVTYQVYEALTNLPIAGTAGSGTILAGASLQDIKLGPLVVGSYYILVSETSGPNSGCGLVSIEFDIKESPILLSVSAVAAEMANCKPNSGAITAIAKDGTGPYTYQILLATAPAPVAADLGWDSANTFNKDAGSYTVYAKDAYGCIAEFDITLNAYDAPTISAPAPICYDGTEFTITITGTVDPAIIGGKTFSVNGSAFKADPNFTFNAAGTYNLVIQDGNGCTATIPYEVYPQLELEVDLTKELDCTGTPSADFTLTATGGNPAGTYTYVYSNDGGISWLPTSAGNVHSTAATGTYVFRVTNDNNTVTSTDDCQATTSITLDPIPVPIITPTVVDASCFGGSDGEIRVVATGGVGPYKYELLGATPVNNTGDVTGIYTGLVAGNAYQVTVTDAKSCPSTTAAITVGEADAVSATSAITTALTCTTANAPTKAVVTITASGGNGNYLYSYDGGLTYIESNVYETYTGETFDVFIKDTNDCPFTLTNGVDIPALNAPTILDISGTPIYCVQQGLGDVTSTVTVTTTAGTGIGALTYTILPSIPVGVTQTGNVFAGLTPGDYTFQVTDANGCTDTALYTVKDVTKINVSGQVTKDVTCFGLDNGEAVFTVSNFEGAYSSALITGTAGSINQVGNKVIITGLTAGVTYTIEVTDATTGCKKTDFVIVSQPAALLTVTGSEVKAANCNYGAKVTADASGGTLNYKYAYQLTTVVGIPADGDFYDSADAVLDYNLGTDWTVYVKDANGCTAQHNFSITIDALPTIDLNANIYCYDGSPMDIVITGTGVGPLQYSIGNGYFPSPNFTLKAPGTYTFYIKDENGCIVSVPYTLNQELLLQADLTQDLICGTDATITLLATQGTGVGTYKYEVSTDGGTTFAEITPVGSNTYTTNVAGDYTFRITDGQNCNSIEKTIAVTPTTISTFTTVETMVSCPGGADGSITITAADGIKPYTYSIAGVNAGAFQTQNYFTGLAAGTYTVTVKDAKGCPSDPVDIVITEPLVLDAKIDVTTPLSCGTGNAAQQAVVTVTVDPTTGTGPYQYSFDGINFSSNNVYKTFTADRVVAYVRDANNCPFTAVLDLTIDALDPPVITKISGTDLWCAAGSTQSTVTVTTSNGVGTPAFEIVSGPITNTTGATSGIFTGLTAGTYLFRVTDTNGCTAEDYYTVKPLVEITASGQEIKAVACVGEANGTLEFKVANYTGGFRASLSPLAGNQTIFGDTVTITGLAAGSYTLNIVDSVTGCPASAPATVTEPSELVLNAGPKVDATCKKDAEVTVSATGGTGTYLYAFKPVAQTPTATDYTQNAFAVLDKTISNWIAYVKDSNGCEAQLPITIATDPLPTGFTADVVSNCTNATGTYEIKVTEGTGKAPFQYSIGSGFQSEPTFTVRNSGNYTITVKDANECEVILPTAVTILAPLNLETKITALPSCTISNGSIEVKVSGGSGTGNYRIQLDNGFRNPADSFVFSNLTHGIHVIKVTDVLTGCDVSYTFDLVKATEITGFDVTKTDVTCFGGNNGSITATIGASATGVNDNPVYTYELTGTTIGGTAITRIPQTSPVFTNLEPGDYTVKVVSGRGCEDQKDVRIEQPAVILVPAPVVAPFGCTTGNETNFATITVSGVTGGSTTYTIYEFFKNGVSVQRSDSHVYTEADYTGGTYTVTVTDDKGCTGSTATAVTIAPYLDLREITIAINTAITCRGLQDITATAVTVTGTPAVVDYKIVGLTDVSFAQTSTTGKFIGLTIGNYLITATNRDTGCFIEKIHYVNNPNTFILQAVKTSDVICFGSNEGTVELTFIDQIPVPASKAGAFTYTVTGPTPSTGTSANAGPLTLTGLTAGLYTVTATLTNSPFCEVSTTFTISQPSAALDLTVSATAITCSAGNNDGTISVTATGGWAGEYDYQVLKDGALFADYSNTTEYTNLTAGVYTINVKDSKGCIDTELVTLVIPTPIAVTAVANPTLLLCNGDTTGTVTATAVTGGQGSNYLFTLNYLSLSPVVSSGPQIDPVFTGLGAGTYSITVTDGWSCAAESAPVTIAEPTAIEASLVVSRTQTCGTLTQLTLSAIGGTGPYTFSTDNVTFSPATFTSSVSFDVLPGVYQYFVKDANGCVGFVSNELTIDPLAPLELVLDINNAKVNCKGDETGVIVATATGALGNYVYTLYDNANNAITPAPVQSTPGRFDGLVAGFYKVKVVSADCAEVWQSAEVTEPAESLLYTAIKTDVSCNGEKNGRLELTATGGTGAIKFAISPRLDQFFDSGTFDKLAPGDYQAIIQDELGCFHVHDFTIVQPEILNAIEVPGATLPEICAGDKDGQFSIEISGGTAPYSVSLGTIDGPYTQGAAGQTVFAFDQLSSGTQTVYYMDSLGCTAEFEIVLEAAAVLNPTVEVTYYCVDNASANLITVTVDASNDPADVDYDLDGSGTFQASNIFTNVAAGKHIITARHSNGCEKQTIEFAVELVEPLTLTISNGQLNQIVATATGGSGEYEYSFNFESFSSNVNYVYYKTDTYTVTVRDKNGCTATVSGQFEYVDVCIPNYFTPNGDGNQDTWGPGCSINYTDLVYTIFDRYGREIAKYRFGQKWDGTYKGAELPTGDYWYVLKLNNPKDDREFVGHFTLYR